MFVDSDVGNAARMKDAVMTVLSPRFSSICMYLRVFNATYCRTWAVQTHSDEMANLHFTSNLYTVSKRNITSATVSNALETHVLDYFDYTVW